MGYLWEDFSRHLGFSSQAWVEARGHSLLMPLASSRAPGDPGSQVSLNSDILRKCQEGSGISLGINPGCP
jgi:hypothetical protein